MIQSLRSRFLLVALGLVAPFALLTAGVLVAWTLSQGETARQTAYLKGQSLASTLEKAIKEVEDVFIYVTGDPDIHWTDAHDLDIRLSRYQNRLTFSPSISVVNPSGYVVAPLANAGTGVNFADREWFQKTLVSDRLVIGQFVISRTSGLPTLPLSRAIREGGRVVAILGMSINLERYVKAVEAAAGPGWVVTLFDASNKVLMRSPVGEGFIGKVLDQSELGSKESRREFLAGTWRGLDGVVRHYAVLPMTIDGNFVGAVTVGQSATAANKESNIWLMLAWTVLGVVLILVTLVAFWGIRSQITVPLTKVSSGVTTMALGQFETRVSLDRLPQELLSMVESINAMASSLQQRDSELESYRKNLEAMVKERTAELEESRTELIRSNGELQQFAYVASHDLQEPLRMVASFTQLLHAKYADKLDQQGKRYVDFAVDGATRMQALINDLLSYSRVQTQAMQPSQVDTDRCLDMALSNLKVLLGERRVVVDRRPLPEVMADPVQLAQVFQNLIGNGIKFCHEDPPRIGVFWREEGDFVEIRVEDNGIGIEPEFADRVFVIFQRLNPRGDYAGNGIGLAICKRIIERHGGEIRCEPREGGGTSFLFTLRRAPVTN